MSILKLIISAITAAQLVYTPVYAQTSQASKNATAAANKNVFDESTTLTKAQLDEFIQLSGLNKKGLTYGELYKNLSPLLPKDLKNKLKVSVAFNGSEKMPQVGVSTFKDSKGHTKFRLTLSKDKIVRSLNIIAEENNFIQYGAMPLSAWDLLNADSAIKKIYAVDRQARNPKLEEQINLRALNWKPVVRDRSEYTGEFKAPTYESYKKMTPYQRAEMLVRLHDTWKAAKNVEFLTLKSDQAVIESKKQFNEFFVQALLGQAVWAAKVDEAGKTFYVGDNKECIDSGYVGIFQQNSRNTYSCMATNDNYKVKDFKTYAAPGCSSICNPMIYGLNDSGKAYCSDAPNRQKATHWEGPCDTSSRLSSLKVVADADIDPNKLNLNDPASYKSIEDKLKAKENDIKLKTEVLLKSLMNDAAFGDKLDANAMERFFKGEASADEFKKRFDDVVKNFYGDISKALNACSSFDFDENLVKAQSVNVSKDGSQQLNACRQLWRRKLAFDIGVNKLCGQITKDKELKCYNAAPTNPPPPVVIGCDKDGTLVEATPPPAPPSKPRPGTSEKEKPAKPPAGVVARCDCAEGTMVKPGQPCPTPQTSAQTEDERNLEAKCGVPAAELITGTTTGDCICKNSNNPPRDLAGKKSCSGKVEDEDFKKSRCQQTGGFANFIECHNLLLPGAIILGTGLLIYYLKNKNKVKDQATDACPNGLQTCPGQYGLAGNNCPATTTWSVTLNKCYLPCGPNEVPNLSTDPTKCDPVSTVISKATSFACWNGQTYASEIFCPNYQCPNGEKVTTPTLCTATQKMMQKSIFEIDK